MVKFLNKIKTNKLFTFITIVLLFNTAYLLSKISDSNIESLKYKLNLNTLKLSFASLALYLTLLFRTANISENIQKLAIFKNFIYITFFSVFVCCLFDVNEKRELFRLCLLATFLFFSLVESTRYLINKFDSNAKRLSVKIFKLYDIILINFIVIILLLEGGLRIYAPFNDSVIFNPPNIKAKHRIQRNKLKPNEEHLGFRANSQGFYDKEFSVNKLSNTYRILGLADSFGVEAVSYNDNFLTLLENYSLPNDNGNVTNIEVLNTGVDQLSPEGYLYLIKHYYKQYNCDFALVCIFIGNDITGLPQKNSDLAFLDKEWWYSYFIPKRYIILLNEKNRKATSLKTEDTSQEVNKQPDNSQESIIPTFSRESFLSIEHKRIVVCRKKYPENVQVKFDRLKDILLEINQITSGNCMFLFIPDEFQANRYLWDELISKYRLNENEYQKNMPQRLLTEFCNNNEIKNLDLLYSMQLKQSEKNLYKHNDTHWNKQGHLLATEIIASHLGLTKK